MLWKLLVVPRWLSCSLCLLWLLLQLRKEWFVAQSGWWAWMDLAWLSRGSSAACSGRFGFMKALVIAVCEGLKSSYRNHHPLTALCSFSKVTELPLIAWPSNLWKPLQKALLLREKAAFSITSHNTPSSVFSSPTMVMKRWQPLLLLETCWQR